MSMAYVRFTYGVPVYRGHYLIYTGGGERVLCKILSVNSNAHLCVKTVEDQRLILHPTWEVKYIGKDAKEQVFKRVQQSTATVEDNDIARLFLHERIRKDFLKSHRRLLENAKVWKEKTFADLDKNRREEYALIFDLIKLPLSERCKRCGGLCCTREFGWGKSAGDAIVSLEDEDERFGWGGPFIEARPDERGRGLTTTERYIRMVDGHCPHFEEGKCKQYALRPFNCRYYDCVEFFAQKWEYGRSDVRTALLLVHERVFGENRKNRRVHEREKSVVRSVPLAEAPGAGTEALQDLCEPE